MSNSLWYHVAAMPTIAGSLRCESNASARIHGHSAGIARSDAPAHANAEARANGYPSANRLN